MFRKLLKAVVIILVVLIGVAGFLAYQIFHPENVLNRFQQSLIDDDFDRAYECLSGSAKSKTGQHEFITGLSSIVPFEIPETYRPAVFNRIIRIAEFEIGEESLFSENQYVMLRVAFPAERSIDRVIGKYSEFQIRKARIQRLSLDEGNSDVIYEETGRLMIDVLDSLSVLERSEIFQYFDVEEIKCGMEFEFWRWKITGEM